MALSGSSVTLLDITTDSKLNFREHINTVVKKHIINYMPNLDVLIWMFYSKIDMQKVEKVQQILNVTNGV